MAIPDRSKGGRESIIWINCCESFTCAVVKSLISSHTAQDPTYKAIIVFGKDGENNKKGAQTK